MTRLAWLTDIHLDHLRLRPKVRQAFAEMLTEDSDCCVITGDISSHVEADLLVDFALDYGKQIYFVMGNHDYWGGSFSETERQVKRLCKEHENLVWLTQAGPISISYDVELCGVDGWYDARFGSWKDSSFQMVDWSAIADFRYMQPPEIVAVARERARGDAMYAQEKLSVTAAKRVIFATHVPPYEQSAMHNGKPSERTSMPWYTNKIMGEVLSNWAEENPHRNLVTLCGHVHSASEYQAAENHLVLCGAAEYGAPVVQRVFEL